jgi:hypothetical protein
MSNNSNNHFTQTESNAQRIQRIQYLQNVQRIQHMQNLNNYKSINNQLSAIKEELDTAKNYFKNEPNQYVLYQIMMIKKKQDHLSKNKDVLKKKLKINFVKRFKFHF